MLSPRGAPQMIGLGLLEAVYDSDIERLADPEDADGDGISGRVNRVWDDARQAVVHGRFGWKAGQPSVHQHSQVGRAACRERCGQYVSSSVVAVSLQQQKQRD